MSQIHFASLSDGQEESVDTLFEEGDLSLVRS